MGNTIIKVENLTKAYTLNHQTGESYVAIRDIITNSFKNIFKNKKVTRVTYEEFLALNDVSFEIEKGDRVGIIGRNGAGKSTLLKILSRITEPTKGKVEIYGRIASLLEVGTGFHPELSGRENIYLNGAILGMSRNEIKSKFDEIVDFAEVEKFLDTPVKRYSSGMYVRLAFAVAAHLEPEILVVDEVLAVGDAQFQKKCLGKMEQVSKNDGRTILFVSHNMGTVLQLCNSAILMERGEIKNIGTPANIIEKYYQSGKQTGIQKVSSSADIYIKEVFACDDDGEMKQNFAHNENINLQIVIVINNFSYTQNIGLVLLRNDKKRVFTVNKDLSSFRNINENEITVRFTINGGLIAPSDYSFLVALNTKSGSVTYDWHEDICPIKVYDDGTEHAFQEGYDYGCIIIKEIWNKINK